MPTLKFHSRIIWLESRANVERGGPKDMEGEPGVCSAGMRGTP